MDDEIWYKQWRGLENYCLDCAKDFDKKLKLTHPDRHIWAYLIDSMPLNVLQDLCKSYTHVYAISEQSGYAIPENCTAYKIPKSFYGTYYADDLNFDRDIVRDYNCFLNRSDVARQDLFYILYERGWLDRGWVSFNLDFGTGYPQGINTPLELFDYNHRTMLSSYDRLYLAVKKIVPYKNFVDTNNQFQRVLETKFSLVVEPYYDRTDSVCFSEKIMRVLQLPRPWVLFGATGSVERLRNMGFDVFDDFVDHSYDALDTSERYTYRLGAMLPEIERLMNITVTPALIQHWKQKAQNNREILRKWSEHWHSDFLSLLDQVYSDATQASAK